MEVITLPNTLHKGRTLLKLDNGTSLDRAHLMIKVKDDPTSSFLLSFEDSEVLISIIQVELGVALDLETFGGGLVYVKNTQTFQYGEMEIKVEDL